MTGFFNWLSQVAAVTKFGLMGIPQRRGSVAAALFGVAGVVGVLVGVLSMAVGFKHAMAASGAPDSAADSSEVRADASVPGSCWSPPTSPSRHICQLPVWSRRSLMRAALPRSSLR